MKILLDENFPLGLLRRPQLDGLTADHIITLGWRGASDARVRERLQDTEVVFLTQDADFLSGDAIPAVVVVSRVRQSRLLEDRIEVWHSCVQQLLDASRPERLFELFDDGTLVPWRDVSKAD